MNINGLADYRLSESADIEEIEFSIDLGKVKLLRLYCMTHRCVLVCTPYRYLSHLIWKKHIQVKRRKLYKGFNFSFNFNFNVPVVNTKLYRLSPYIAASEN